MDNKGQKLYMEHSTPEERQEHVKAQLVDALSKLQTNGLEAVDAFVITIQWNDRSDKGEGITIDGGGTLSDIVNLLNTATLNILFG